MGLLELPEIDPGIAQSEIREIIFPRCLDIGLSLDVIPICRLDEEGVLKIVDVFPDRIADDRTCFRASFGIYLLSEA